MYRSSLTRSLITALAILMSCLFATTVILAWDAWRNFALAGRIALLTRTDRTLFGAIVTVRSQVPDVSTALIADEDPAPVIAAAQQSAASAMNAALDALDTLALPDGAPYLDAIRAAWRAQQAAQPAVERLAALPRALRDLAASDAWRESVNATIDALNQGSVAVGSAGQLDDPVVAGMVQIRRTAWTIRDRYGLQCSLLRANVERGQPLTASQTEILAGYRTIYQTAWQSLDDVQLGPAVPADLRAQIRAARQSTEQAQAVVDSVIGRLDGSGRPAMPGADWTATCDGPFDSILAVSRLAQVEASNHAERIRANAFRSLLIAGLDLAAVMAFGVFAVINVQRRLARPMRLLTGSIERLTRRDFAEPVPPTAHPDELGAMARALESLRTSELEAERLQSAMSRFTADASHQLRTPLSVLRTHIAVLDGMIPADHEAQSSLEDIRSAADRLQRLLTQLVALARADGAPAPETDAAGCDLQAVTREVASDYAPRAIEAGIELQLLAPSRALRCAANPTLVSEILANLLDNAIRYAGSGGTVTIRLARRGNRPTIEIEDDGPGIPPAEREKVFTRFYRLSRDQNRAGSGLGLAIVQSLSTALGATIEIDDGAGGRGLRVRISF